MAELLNPSVDFSSLGQLPQLWRQGQTDALRKQTLANLGQGGQADAMALLKSGDLSLAQLGVNMQNRDTVSARDARDFAFREREAQRAQANFDKSLGAREKEPENVRAVRAAGIDPASPEGRKALFPRTDTPISAGDKKAVMTAEDDLPNLDGTLEALKIAKDLNTKTFTGATAGIRGTIGTKIPGGGLFVDKDAAMATSEFGKVMSGEAIKTMADTLKGATTDFELKKFESMMADPATPPEIRGRMIDRMIRLSEAHRATKLRRINELRGGTYFKESNQPTAAVPSQGNGADVMLKHAKDALAKGADRGAVLLRLQQAGISPDGI